MQLKILKAKIHRATVTFTDVNYHGSITLDPDLLEPLGLLPNEAVLIADCENGNRFETYIIQGERGSGIVGINGAAARLTAIGNRVIIMAFAYVDHDKADQHVSRVIIPDAANKPGEIISHPTRIV
jgi:aspartate 1-decarboxylase